MLDNYIIILLLCYNIMLALYYFRQDSEAQVIAKNLEFK